MLLVFSGFFSSRSPFTSLSKAGCKTPSRLPPGHLFRLKVSSPSTVGYTVNFENPATQYRTGNEFHLEYFLGQHLPKGFALGPCLTFNGKIAGQAIGLKARYYNELKSDKPP